jgi:tRNA threonylcarbamoyladenosine biosynthesis protein TsaE
MGSGKTTTIKSICEALGSADNINSPTFSIVNEYIDSQNKPIYHFDFYRIETEVEAIDIGCDEYFYSNELCLIEWSEKIPSLIPPKNIEISIKLVGENHREIQLLKND